MTVQADDALKEYPGNGVAVLFDGPRLFDPDTLTVTLVDDATGAVTSPSYTLTNVGVNGPSLVQMDVAPALGYTLQLRRTLAYAQTSNFTNQQTLLRQVVENTFDVIVMLIQQLADGLSRSFRFGNTVVGADPTLPAPVPLATFRWNGLGKSIEYYFPDAFAAPSGSDQVGFLQAGGGAVARTSQEKMRVELNPEDFGAVADDTTASQPGLALAVTQALTTGGEITLQRGVYKAAYSSGDAVINIDAPITGEPDVDRRSVVLRGQGAGNTVIKSMTAAKYAIKLTGGLGIEAHGYESHGDFSIVAGVPTADGLHVFNKAYTQLQNITLQGLNTGLLLESVLSSRFENIQARNNAVYGVHLKKGTGFSGVNANQFDSCKFQSNVVLGLHSEAFQTGLVFNNCNFENNGRHGQPSEGGAELIFNGSEGRVGATFVGGYFESNGGGADLFLTNTDSSYVTVVLIGTVFNRNIAARYVTNCIKTTGKIRLQLIGCAFASYNGYVPNAGRPYISGDADLILEHQGCVFMDAVEAPTVYSLADKLPRAGTVSSAGSAVRLPAGWSCSKLGTGSYRVTHNLGDTNYSVAITTNAGGAQFPLTYTPSANSFDVAIVNSGFASTDSAFAFTLTRN